MKKSKLPPTDKHEKPNKRATNSKKAKTKPYQPKRKIKPINRPKRGNKVTQEPERKYKTLVENSLQGIVVIQDFRIVFTNVAFSKISGYTIRELMSLPPQKVKTLIHPEDQELVWGRMKKRLSGKFVPPHYEYRGIRKDGTERWLEMYTNRIEYNGKSAIQGSIIDI